MLHLAAKTFVPNSFKNPEIIYRENYLSMINILEYCRLNSIKKLIFLSSYVYGKPDYLPIDEKHKTHIENPYGRSKLHCESLCNSYAQDYGLDIIVLRPFNIFGNGQNKEFLFPTIINQLQHNWTFKDLWQILTLNKPAYYTGNNTKYIYVMVDPKYIPPVNATALYNDEIRINIEMREIKKNNIRNIILIITFVFMIIIFSI